MTGREEYHMDNGALDFLKVHIRENNEVLSAGKAESLSKKFILSWLKRGVVSRKEASELWSHNRLLYIVKSCEE